MPKFSNFFTLRLATIGLMAIFFSALSACGGGGGGSDVGDQNDVQPFALAQAVGTSATIEGVVTMRSGGEVILTGKESDGVDDPLHSFNWFQTDSSGLVVDLIERTVSSKSFTAPNVAAPTDLVFELTVVDSGGATGTDSVTVRVVPGSDSDAFLAQKLVGSLSSNSFEFVVAVEPGETTNSEFRLNLETVATWVDREGRQQELVVSNETIDGEWPEGVTGTENFATEFFNPHFTRPLPVIDVDEINKFFEAPGDRGKRLETSDIDQAEIFINFSFDSFDNNARIILLFPDSPEQAVLVTADGQVESGRISLTQLNGSAGLESSESAAKYYALINAPQTLSQWLAQAGFGEDPDSQPDVAHAVYLNNYDLGFGRDMYLRVDAECGNVYSFVGNYPTLEDAILNRNNFATVVMEYSPVDGSCSGEKIVKFLNYVPDESSGDDVLVKTMNFDGRGEKAVPGVCTACHGGSLNDLSSFGLEEIAGLDDAKRLELADLDSSFMLWDLDSFLYTDTDPAITSDRQRITEADLTNFSRAGQEAAFKALNRGTLLTYVDDPERYEAPIKLVHGWYGTYDGDPNCQADGTEAMPDQLRALPSATFNGEYVPCGWESEAEFYLPTYAQNCRICHTQLSNKTLNFDTAAEALTNPKLERFVFQEGVMPMARLTFDRFWANFEGKPSGASTLLAKLGLPADTQPGLPQGIFTPVPAEPDAGAIVALNGQGSLFADSHAWTLTSDCGDDATLVGANSSKASFVAGGPGCSYEVTLTVSNTLGSEVSTATVSVADPAPVAVDFVAPLDAYMPGDESLLIEVLSLIEEVGDGSVELIVNETGLPFNLEANPNVSNNGDGSLSYFLDNPFGVQDTFQYQLQDANGTLSELPGSIMLALDPIVPTLSADGSATSVTLNFSLPEVISADGFRVFRGSSVDNLTLLTTIEDGDTRTYIDAPLETKQTFVYQVSAVSGSFESEPSSAVEVITMNSLITGVRVVNTGATSIEIAWNTLDDAVAYIITRGGSEVARVAAPSAFYKDIGLSPNTEYSYRVIGEFADGSQTTRSSVLVAQTRPVGPPSFVQASPGSCAVASQVAVAWTPVPGADAYVVSGPGGATQVAGNTTATVIGGVTPNTTVAITVQTLIAGIISPPNQGVTTSCVSWQANIFPALPTCSSGGCHLPVGGQSPAIGSDANSTYSAAVGSTCLLTGACGSTMISVKSALTAAGGDIWISQGAQNN